VLLDAAAPFDALVTSPARRHAERAGLDSLWAGDHLLLGDTPLLDSTLTLAAAAAVTRTITIGSAVFLPSLRPLVWPAGRSPPSPTSPPADWSWASGPARARSRSTARQVSGALTAGGARTSSSRPFPACWPVVR